MENNPSNRREGRGRRGLRSKTNTPRGNSLGLLSARRGMAIQRRVCERFGPVLPLRWLYSSAISASSAVSIQGLLSFLTSYLLLEPFTCCSAPLAWSSLPDAEGREDPAEKVIRRELARDLAQVMLGLPEVLGHELTGMSIS